jgi:uncharacterized protein YhfF
MPYLPEGCARPDLATLDAYWAKAREALPPDALPESYQVRWIGLDDESTRQIFELIAAGDKTGTFTLPWIVERTDQPTPREGEAIILVDFQGEPTMIVRLTEIWQKPFGEITEADTAIDGTPVRSLSVWKPLHTQYWNGLLAPFGLEVADDMPVWMERFELVYPP